MILSDIFTDQLINALVWTIIHSLWQFSLIAVVMSFFLKTYQHHQSKIRYQIALTSLVLSVCAALFTFIHYYYQTAKPDSAKIIFTSVILSDKPSSGDLSLISWICQWIDIYQTPIFIIWIVGVGLFSIKFLFSLVYVEFLSITSKPLYCQATIDSFGKVCRHFRITSPIRISESKYIKSPAILGFFKPVILFPIGIINHLDLEETEAIMAHEIAHFVRKDFYINLIQTLIEVLFYYHPAIWWISANIRLERENCCDELAIGYTGDNIYYAKTLVKMQELYIDGSSPALALNFSKKESYFSNRIKRILNMAQTRNFLKEKIITSILLVALVTIFSKQLTGSTIVNSGEKKNQEITMIISDTIPNKKESIRIQKKTNDQEIKIAMENGKVTELEVDGKKIDQKDFDKYSSIIAEVKPKSSESGNARMFYLGNGDHQPFEMRLDELKDMDTLFNSLRIKTFELPGFSNDLQDLGYNHEKLNIHLKNLREHLNKMQFNFNGLDSLDLNFRGFTMPDIKEWQGLPDIKFFDFEGPNSDILKYDRHNLDERDKAKNSFPGFDGFENSKSFSDIIGNSLNNDGLLLPGKQNKVELTGKFLKINGEKQPSNIWQKYKRIFEEESGTSLQKNSRLEFNFEGQESKRKFRVY